MRKTQLLDRDMENNSPSPSLEDVAGQQWVSEGERGAEFADGSGTNRVPSPSLSLPTVSGSRPQTQWETVLWTGLGFTRFRTALRALPNTGGEARAREMPGRTGRCSGVIYTQRSNFKGNLPSHQMTPD